MRRGHRGHPECTGLWGLDEHHWKEHHRRHPKKVPKKKKSLKCWPWAGHCSIWRRLKSRRGAKQSAPLFTRGVSLPCALAVTCIYLAGSAWWTDERFCCFNQHLHWSCHDVCMEKISQAASSLNTEWEVGVFALHWTNSESSGEDKALESFICLFCLCETTYSDTWMLGKHASCIRQMRWGCYLDQN